MLFLCDPEHENGFDDVNRMARLCDQQRIPFAAKVATAEMLVLGLSRGDLDWREIIKA